MGVLLGQTDCSSPWLWLVQAGTKHALSFEGLECKAFYECRSLKISMIADCVTSSSHATTLSSAYTYIHSN